MLNGPSGDRAGTRDSTIPMREARTPGLPVLADNFPLPAHNDLQKSFLQIVPVRPLRAAIQPAEAETARNSLSRNILQGTSLL